MSKIKVISFVMLFAYAVLLGYFVDPIKNIIAFCLLFIFYVAESIRSYAEGLGRGVEIIKEIQEGK